MRQVTIILNGFEKIELELPELDYSLLKDRLTDKTDYYKYETKDNKEIIIPVTSILYLTAKYLKEEK